MQRITLKEIIKKDNKIVYVFEASEGLSNYFSERQFQLEYPEKIETVPDSIAAIPFVCNVLPIIWLTDSELHIKELDRAFYECIPNVKKGYETMFPESTFAGTILVDRIADCDCLPTNKCAALFSGGLDAVNTLINHFDEKPALISIWGSDIKYDNEEGWARTHRGIAEYAQKYNLPDVVIRSTFREFDRERQLQEHFGEQLKDTWWHGVKHALGLLGHVAPYAYLHGLSTVYIASTNCEKDGPVRCASNPLTDNHVRYALAQVVHDGFEFSRQDKAHNVVEYVKKSGDQVSLHVCWETQSGSNCCRCEKCYRTMSGILAEGDDCTNYGFANTPKTLPEMRTYIALHCKDMEALPDYWKHIAKRIVDNKKVLKKKHYWKHIRWMEKVDFLRAETIKMPLDYRIRTKLYSMRFYQMLHRLKEKIYG